jgi:hypothetical protein
MPSGSGKGPQKKRLPRSKIWLGLKPFLTLAWTLHWNLGGPFVSAKEKKRTLSRVLRRVLVSAKEKKRKESFKKKKRKIGETPSYRFSFGNGRVEESNHDNGEGVSTSCGWHEV